MALTNNQKHFIRMKIKKLGNIEKVKEFYRRDSLVCEYAHQIAKKLFNKRILKRRG